MIDVYKLTAAEVENEIHKAGYEARGTVNEYRVMIQADPIMGNVGVRWPSFSYSTEIIRGRSIPEHYLGILRYVAKQVLEFRESIGK